MRPYFNMSRQGLDNTSKILFSVLMVLSATGNFIALYVLTLGRSGIHIHIVHFKCKFKNKKKEMIYFSYLDIEK